MGDSNNIRPGQGRKMGRGTQQAQWEVGVGALGASYLGLVILEP